MLPATLHPGGGDRPHLGSQVDFTPSRPKYLACSGRRQNYKFQSSGSLGGVFSKPLDEGANLGIWKSSVMLNSPHLGRAGKQLIEAAFPARRVIGVTETTGRCPIKHRLDATANSACCLRLGRPNRLKHLYDEPNINGLNRQTPKGRRDVSG